MPVQAAQITAWIAAFAWALSRVGGLFLVAPVLGATTIPVNIRVGIALALVVVIAPMAPMGLEPMSGQGIGVLAQQMLLGALIGFVLRIVFEAVAFGAQLISTSMSLSYAETVNPLGGGSSTVVSQFYTGMITLLFLAMDGHLQLIGLLADSFQTTPIGGAGVGTDEIWGVLMWTGHLFSGALRVALPALTALLVVNLGFGAISRSAPSMNLFAVGFPITVSLGLVAIWLALRQLPGAFDSLSADGWATMRGLIGGGSP
ncbi:flagellar biosynthetic protein FliR [Pinirhizobacter sp.]|jgi:flagellar biosynthetic protein FliR|uniref:flagellar biosynthetic protein FliR n=1 Tax=Pinirhizobacter sp. TaxID=2950432 RepID=UPI002F42B5B8